MRYLTEPAQVRPAIPRQADLDTPDALHHIMVRWIERTRIFCEDSDRVDFVARLAQLAEQEALNVCAWALLPNHAHLLISTGTRRRPRSPRRLRMGDAGTFHRHHTRGPL
jgi:REP-associated tyrosine transposase